MINACKQKKLTLTTGLISFLLFVMLGSCNKSSHEHQQNLSKNNFKSLVFDLPAKDSIKPAEIEMYDEQKYEKYAVRKKVIHESDESLYAAGPGRKLKISMPWLKKLLNLNGIILPSVPAKGEQQQGFFPEVTLAKDMAHTNTNPMGISYFGKVQGLKHDYVCKMIQDKTGNIWIATRGGGLCKYDGKYFTHFTEKKGFLSNEIWALMEDSKGNIWIGSNGNGVAVYEGN
jgi:ligand-binding sensor domain-containing protein